MQITITARHFDLTKAIRDHIEEATEKLEKYFDHIININYILSLDNSSNNVELILHIPRSNLKSNSSSNDMYLAIDDAVDKMEKQVKKLKDKWTDHQKKKSLHDSSQFVYANLIKKGQQRDTVKIKRILAESMYVKDAIDIFEESEDPYFVFKNIETDRINVLVKRDEEHYKLIEP